MKTPGEAKIEQNTKTSNTDSEVFNDPYQKGSLVEYYFLGTGRPLKYDNSTQTTNYTLLCISW